MKTSFTAIVLSLAVLSPALATEDAELDALRDQLRDMQRQVQDASRRLRDMELERNPGARNSRSFSFSYTTDRPMVGVLMESGGDDRGVRLAGVTPGSPAEEAGLQAGDVLTAIDGHQLTGSDALDDAYDAFDDMQEGQTFAITYERDGDRRETTVTAEVMSPSVSLNLSGLPDIDYSFGFRDFDLDKFRELADMSRKWQFEMNEIPGLDQVRPFVWQLGWAWSGLELAPLNKQLGRYFGADRGTLVIEAEGLGDSDLQGGDVILEVGGQSVSSPREVMNELRKIEPGKSAELIVIRDGKRREVAVVAPELDGNASFGFTWSDDE